MAVFEVIRHTPLSGSETWDRLTDWERHGQFIPFTTITLTGIVRSDVGETFVARTGLGRLHFDDPMEVTHWQPPIADEPGRCRIVKRGSVVTGWAELTVVPDADGATVRWREEAGFRTVGRVLDWPNGIAGRLIFGRLVDKLLDDSSR